MTRCPACRAESAPGDFRALSEHFRSASDASEPAHVRWLNQSVGKRRLTADELAKALSELFALPEGGLAAWMRERFIGRFFAERPHPFVAALQHPSRGTLIGYAIEHQHFLKQWVRSCALIAARTDQDEVARYEIDNLRTEFGGDGPDRPAHYELLLRMGESYGLTRAEILGTPPLPTTARAIAEWQEIAETQPWVETMAAMHSLELIAHRGLRPLGARWGYFEPAILRDGSITAEAAAFLREGYEADLGHADEALALIEKYAAEGGRVGAVQGTFLRSLDLFDDYLLARLERGERYGPSR